MSDAILKDIGRRIDERLARLFEEVSSPAKDGLFEPPGESEITAQVRDMTFRSGKRLRPAALVCAAALFEEGALDDRAVIDASAAMELMHVYFLIHDDIMDDDEVRRGGPSVHAALGAKTGSEKLGRDLAILCGDLAMALHGTLLAGLCGPVERILRAQALFSRMHRDVIHGQAMDLMGVSDSEETALHKTASYTTVGPLVIGAALGGADEGMILRLGEIGAPMGVAFQLRDDVLGIFGDPSVTGKPVGTDLSRGKRTLLLSEALSRCSATQRRVLDAVVGAEDAPAEAVAEAMEILVETGALGYCEDRILSLASASRGMIEQEDFLPEGKRLLLHICNTLVERRT